MRASSFDRWITTDPRDGSPVFDEVTRESLCEQCQGHSVPLFVDELVCSGCSAPVGWDSDGGFRVFFTEQTETVLLCEDCHTGN